MRLIRDQYKAALLALLVSLMVATLPRRDDRLSQGIDRLQNEHPGLRQFTAEQFTVELQAIEADADADAIGQIELVTCLIFTARNFRRNAFAICWF